jgi:hypothetical protein
MITDNYGRNCNTDTRKTEELFAKFSTNPARYVSGWKLAIPNNNNIRFSRKRFASGETFYILFGTVSLFSGKYIFRRKLKQFC